MIYLSTFGLFSANPCQYPDPPANGERTCRESKEGVHCTLSCLDGYAFVVEPATEYFCADDNGWGPSDKLPFPDCAGEKAVVAWNGLRERVIDGS